MSRSDSEESETRVSEYEIRCREAYSLSACVNSLKPSHGQGYQGRSPCLAYGSLGIVQ
jgi:hypothetical protein